MKKIVLATTFCSVLFGLQNNENVLKNTLNTKDIKDKKAKKYIDEWSSEKFGLKPYRPNYLLPFGYTSHNYKEYTPTDGEYKNVEAEFQVSFKLLFYKNLFGQNEKYYASYTQRSFWQLYIESSPFRESNYNPEIFVIFPMGDKEVYGLKTLEFGYSHHSNGQGNIDKTDNADQYPNLYNRSRSINKLYTKFTFQHGSLIWDLNLWTRIGNLEDNPDIMDYYGYGSIHTMYFYKKSLFDLTFRLNPIKLKGALEFSYSYPTFIDGVYLYTKIFTGYGESLIDYNTNLTKYSVGISFSR